VPAGAPNAYDHVQLQDDRHCCSRAQRYEHVRESFLVPRLSRLYHGAFPGQPDGVDFFGGRFAGMNRPVFRGVEDPAEFGDHVSGGQLGLGPAPRPLSSVL